MVDIRIISALNRGTNDINMGLSTPTTYTDGIFSLMDSVEAISYD